MSAAQTIARRLEETVRTALSAAAGTDGVTLLLQNEDLPAGSDEARVPCVIIMANEKDENLDVRIDGRNATECELSMECRVAGNREDSPRAIEALAETVRAAWEGAYGISGWKLLVINFTGDERRFAKSTRAIVLKYSATVFPA